MTSLVGFSRLTILFFIWIKFFMPSDLTKDNPKMDVAKIAIKVSNTPIVLATALNIANST